MSRYSGQTAFRVLLLGGSVFLSSIAVAQSLPSINTPPVRSPTDQNGVNLATAILEYDDRSISIGDPKTNGLSYARYWTGNGWRDNYVLSITQLVGALSVNVGSKSHVFSVSGAGYTNTQGDGSTLSLSGSTYTFTESNGTIIHFQVMSPDADVYYNTALVGLGNDITNPNGQMVNLFYTFWVYRVGSTNYDVYLLTGARSSNGYLLKFDYNPSHIMTKVAAINLGVDYCAGGLSPCTGLTQNWPSLTFGTNSYGQTVTDALGNVYQYGVNSSSQLIGVRVPSRPSADFQTIGYDGNGRVSSVATPYGTWTYSWSLSGSTLTATVTDPLSHQRTTTASTTASALTSDRNALSYTTTYALDGYGRTTQATYPEGNYAAMAFDGRGNVTQIRRVAKAGSGLADIYTYANYDTTCSNAIKCNQPNWTKDGNGNETDYGYDATTGLLTSVTQPAAVAGGTRPHTTYTYSVGYGFFKDYYGNIVSSGVATQLLTGTSSCAMTASCVGTADEVKTVVGYGPQVAGTANTLLPVTMSQGAGDGSLTATTTTVYDGDGNPYTVTDPLGLVTRYHFDDDRHQTGIISPDPDGSGSLKNRAVRMTYNADGLLSMTEKGTVNSQSDPDWAYFSSLQQVGTTWDAYDRKVQDTITAGGTTYAVKQYSYDAANRSSCTTTRMNPAVFGSISTTDACTAGTVGSFGPDRIAQRSYDAADELIGLTTAYGTAQAQASAFTYNPNGTQATFADPNNNLATNVYDGFDRLSQTRYPSLTTPGTSSTTDYEQLAYDANSNIVGRRVRDGSSITYAYDNLNRLTSKSFPTATGNANPAFTYDLLGRMLSANNANSSYSTAIGFGYDALSRQISETSTYNGAGTATKTMGYDLDGRRIQLTWPDAFYVTYDYDTVGEMTAIHENGGTVLASYGYDDLGERTSKSYANGLGTAYGYDAVSRLTSLSLNGGSSATAVTLGSYNPADQTGTRSNSNDAYSSRQIYNTNRAYASNGLNQYTLTGNFTLGYDGNANLTSIGASAFSFGVENTLTSGGGGNFWHDALHRLVYSTTSASRFDYTGTDIVTVYNAANAIARRYVFGPDIDEPVVWYEGSDTSNRRFLDSDERGSITRISDASGATLAINSYDEYGQPSSGNLGSFGYTGQMWLPEIQMYYYKARIYAPHIGRFLQPDSIGYGGGFNLYAYAGNDPIGNSDPMGTATLNKQHMPTPGDRASDLIIVTANTGNTTPTTAIEAIKYALQPYFGQIRSSGLTPQKVVIDSSCAGVGAVNDPNVQKAALDDLRMADLYSIEIANLVSQERPGSAYNVDPMFTSGQPRTIHTSEAINEARSVEGAGRSVVLYMHTHQNNTPPSPVGANDRGTAAGLGVVVAAIDRAGNITCTARK